MEQEAQQQLEKIEGKPGIPIPPLPRWPTSIPGPLVTEPPQGQRRMSTRTDQVVEVEYNQETFDAGSIIINHKMCEEHACHVPRLGGDVARMLLTQY